MRLIRDSKGIRAIIWLPLHKSSLHHNLCHIWCYPSEGFCSPEDQILQSKYRSNNMKSTQQRLGCRRVEEPYNSWRKQYTIFKHFCGGIGSGTFWSFGASPNCSTAGAQPAVCSFHLWWACEGSTFLHIFYFMTFKIITLLLLLKFSGCLGICQVSKFVVYGLCLSSLCNISLEMKLHHSMTMSNNLWSSSMTWSHSGFPFVFCTSDLCLQLSGYMRAWQIAHRCESYELQRFPVLRRRIEEVVASFLRDGLAPAETMIGHLIEMEVLFYPYHRDFLDGQNVVWKNGLFWYVTAYCIEKMMLRWIFPLLRICCAAFVVQYKLCVCSIWIFSWCGWRVSIVKVSFCSVYDKYVSNHKSCLQMDYINTSHPGFLGGSKAVEAALQQQWGSKVSTSNITKAKVSAQYLCTSLSFWSLLFMW